MQFKLGSSLGYSVTQKTPFVFNVEMQTTDVRTVVTEELVLTPGLISSDGRCPKAATATSG